MENKVSKRQYFNVGIICFINLINYMDRYTVASMLADIQETFDLTVAQGGLLQTAFIVVYMFMAPLFGYLGDRYNRKWLLTVGIFFWSLATLIGSFMKDYGSFLALRCLVGIGEASYTTIAPTLISDLFIGNKRSQMLAIFNFAIPVGAGMGYMLGSIVLYGAGAGMTDVERIDAGVWRWGLRITPVLGVIAVVLIIWLLEDPPRGEVEGSSNIKATSMSADLKYLLTNKAFVLNTMGFTAVTFVMGALAWWAPYYIGKGVQIQESSNVPEAYVSIIFGAESMASGLIGVPLGSYIGQKLRVKYPKADPLVCGIGVLIAAPLLILTTFLAEVNTLAAIIVCFLGQIFQNLNWSVVTDMMLYTVIPTRRSSAGAILILVSHALGDAGSPYLMGVIAGALEPLIPTKGGDITTEGVPMTTTDPFSSTFYSTESWNVSTTTLEPEGDTYAEFKSLQYSMAIVEAVDILAAILFVWLAFYIAKAKKKVDDIMQDSKDDISRSSSISGIKNLAYEDH